MNTKFTLALVLSGIAFISAPANERSTQTVSAAPFNKENVSYAFGMNLGLSRAENKTELNTDAFLLGLKDVLEEKPTQLQESELTALFNRATESGGYSQQDENTKRKLSYAMGMKAGTQLKRAGTDVDADVIGQGLKDVLEGRPTKLKKSDLPALFEQAKSHGHEQLSIKNKAAGEAFLKKNAKEPGVQILPDGLQYRIIEEGTGPTANTNDSVYIKMRGSFVDGKQFIRHNHYLIRCGGGCQGWADALPRMKIGSKWRIFIPANLAYGEEGEPAWGVGPDATVIFDLEMLSIAPPDAEFGRGRLGHAFEDSDIPEPETTASK